jgi:hypothetical protein
MEKRAGEDMDRRAVRFERGFIFVRASSGNAMAFADLSSLTVLNANTEFSLGGALSNPAHTRLCQIKAESDRKCPL